MSLKLDEWDEKFITEPQRQLIWICQRELQRNIAKTMKQDENLPGNAALIMLFLLGFPLLKIREVQYAEVSAEEHLDKVQAVKTKSFADAHDSINMSPNLWRVWSYLAPQDISLVLGVDMKRHKVSLRLQNDSNHAQFI